jgi:hypothetical protein
LKSSPLKRTVDGFYCELDDAPLRLDFLRVRQARGGLHSGVWVDLVASAKISGGWRDFHESRYNLSSVTTRRDLSKFLSSRVIFDGATPEDWLHFIDSVCSSVCRATRQGKEPICLGSRADPGPPAYLVEPILEDGQLTIMYGDKSSGKSQLALALAYAVHDAIDGLLTVPVQQRPVLYLDWETGEDEQTRRLYRMARGLGAQEPPLIDYLAMERPLADDADSLRKRAEGRLVVIDSLVPACGGDAREEAATAFWHAVRAMSATILCIAQTQKRQQGEKRARSVFGSVMFEYAARSIWLVRGQQERGSKTQHVAIAHEKCNNGPLRPPQGWCLTFEEDATTFRAEDPKAISEFSDMVPLRDQVKALLYYGERKSIDLAAELNRSESTVRKILSRYPQEFIKRGEMWGLRSERDNDRDNCAT